MAHFIRRFHRTADPTTSPAFVSIEQHIMHMNMHVRADTNTPSESPSRKIRESFVGRLIGRGVLQLLTQHQLDRFLIQLTVALIICWQL